MVKVTAGSSYSIETLYQWDTNKTLEIHGLSFGAAPEIHFAHVGDRFAIARQSEMDAQGVIRCDIPNSLLQKGQKINAFVCTVVGDDVTTHYKITIPVEKRNRPADYDAPEEYETYDLDQVGLEVVTLETGAEATIERVLVDDKIVLRFGMPGGMPGKNATVKVKRTETLPANSAATVENVGTDSDVQLVFGIPEGKPGAPLTYDQLTDEQKAELKGKDGVTPAVWTMTGNLTAAVNGTASVSLYKDGVLATEPAYLVVLVSSGGAAFREHGTSTGAITGTKSWTYGGDANGMAWQCSAYADSSRSVLLASCLLTAGATGASGSGSGDMSKATYDADGDGVVDNAAALEGKKAADFAAADHGHTPASIGAAAADHSHSAADVGADPAGTAADAVAAHLAATNPHGITPAGIGAATADHKHSAADVGAATADHKHSAADVGADPTGTAANAVSAHNTADDAHAAKFAAIKAELEAYIDETILGGAW